MRLTTPYTGPAKVETATGEVCNVIKRKCPLNLVVATRKGPLRVIMEFLELPGPGKTVIIGQKTLESVFNVDVGGQIDDYAERLNGGGIQLDTRTEMSEIHRV